MEENTNRKNGVCARNFICAVVNGFRKLPRLFTVCRTFTEFRLFEVRDERLS